MSRRKKLRIQVGTQQHVLAVYDPDVERWEYLSPLGEWYLKSLRDLGFTDPADAGPSVVEIVEA